MAKANKRLKSAMRHHREGRLDIAEQSCQQVLKADPECHEALYMLGLLASQAGRFDSALPWLQRAIHFAPMSAPYHSLLGHVLCQMGQIAAAEQSCRRALALNPGLGEAHFNLGTVYQKGEDRSAAIDCYRRALELEPDNVAVCLRLGNLLFSQNKDEGLRQFERALQINPSHADAKACLVLAHLALASLHSTQGKTESMLDSYRRALEIQPNHAEAHWNLSNDLLRRGNFQEGWREYEWRWKWAQFTSQRRNFHQSLWRGKPLNGARILLHAEQGLGDTIQFVRYAPLVSAKGGKVILEVDRALHRLLASMPGVERIICRGERLPDFDFHCPLMSLPLAFGTTLETVPASVPYITVDPEHGTSWTQRTEGTGFKVGLVWAGSPAHSRDRRRSIPLESFAPLTRAESVRLFSLQKGPATEEAARTPAGMNLVNWTDLIADFADTAAIIAGMDLVITVDTSVAHLAGAMGKPVWILVPLPSDWRWMLDREDSPWYPTARLFRQTETEKWEPVIEKLIHEFFRLFKEPAGI